MFRVITAVGVIAALCGACEQGPLEISCPTIEAGELVVTEIHGPQTGNDQYGEWLELYNASGKTIDLSGLSVVFFKLDGSQAVRLLVREQTQVKPDSYVVIGRQVAGSEPVHVDYGYISDIDRDLYDSAAIEVSSCGTFIDLVVYRNLPTKGSLILDGSGAPTAVGNDVEANWCVDNEEDANSDERGVRGSPREGNPSC